MKPLYLTLALLLCAPLQAQMLQLLAGTPPATSSFNPQTQGTLVNWYDGSTLGLSNGANVNPFTDSKTGAPNSLTTSGTYPTYATGQQNGLGTVNFGNGNGAFDTGGSTASSYPRTIAAVVKWTDNTKICTILGPNGSGGIQFRIDATTGYLTFNKANVAAIGTGNVALVPNQYHLIVGVLTSTTWAFYIDGTAAGSGTHSQTLTGGLLFRLGANGSIEKMYGYMGEVQIYSSALDSTDLAALRSYISAKWGTP